MSYAVFKGSNTNVWPLRVIWGLRLPSLPSRIAEYHFDSFFIVLMRLFVAGVEGAIIIWKRTVAASSCAAAVSGGERYDFPILYSMHDAGLSSCSPSIFPSFLLLLRPHAIPRSLRPRSCYIPCFPLPSSLPVNVRFQSSLGSRQVGVLGCATVARLRRVRPDVVANVTEPRLCVC